VVGVSNMDEALQLFETTMGLQRESDGPLPAPLARFWGVDRVDGVDGVGGVDNGVGWQTRRVELSCQGYPIGRLELLELTPTAHEPTANEPTVREVVRLDTQLGGPDSPLDIGPKAIDFYVRSPARIAWEQMVAAGCIARSPPVRHVIGDVESEEAVLFGPDGVPLLIMVGHRHPPTQMRPGAPHGPYSEVPTVSVVAGDLAATRAFYADTLGLQASTDAETPAEFRDAVNALVGIPAGSPVHFLLYQDPEEPSGKILLVHFSTPQPARRLTDRMHPRRLGVALYRHATPNLDALCDRIARLAARSGATLVQAPTQVGETRRMWVRGPNEELFEFFED
jgi:catechol 2,3-dioxygenase-like lactoylglutathione lyase family enzyme